MSDLTIPEEAIEKAAIRQAGMAAGDEGQWRGYWNYTRAALETAAPLIVAAELERIAESINYDRFRSKTSTGLVTSVDLVREEILARASVLRGEGRTGVSDEELPGMWSNADLSGGQTEVGEGEQ